MRGYPNMDLLSLSCGNKLVYRSSGYVQVTNLFLGGSEEGWEQINGMIRDLSGMPWPSEDVHLSGPGF